MFAGRRLIPLLIPVLLLAPAPAAEPVPERVSFNRDIRPILSENCFKCHGPDKAKRKADLRLDTEEGVFGDLGGRQAIVPGDPEKSELFARITSHDAKKRMPPARLGPKLSERDIELIRRWIQSGAQWQKHWAFIPPVRPNLPGVQNASWPRNGIDYFIMARLEKEPLAVSPEADRATLIRRATLDLTGLPPTPEEVDVFLADCAPGAYERVIDRLLASPRCGERMALPWLNAARYADSNGYQQDGERFMWRWRDWVIDALNANMPFDQFTVEQLAGDMLPGATLEQKIASGFNRNHRGNGEGGIIPEEYAVEYVVDRVDTTSTVWLGLTLGCARCHEHKFDPIAHKEFYQVFAFFNNIPEKGRAIKYGNSPPLIKAPTRTQQRHLNDLEADLAAAETAYSRLGPVLAAAQETWERTLDVHKPILWSPAVGVRAHFTMDGDLGDRTGGSSGGKFKGGDAAWVPGRFGQAADFDGKRFIAAGDVGDFGFYDKFSLAAWIYPKGDDGGAILSRMLESENTRGYCLRLKQGRLQLNLVQRWLDDALHVETESTLQPERWHHVAVSYDGTRLASGVRIFIDGRPQKLRVLLDELNQTFATKEPFRIGTGGGPSGRFHGQIDEVQIYDRVLSDAEAELLATTDPINEIAALPRNERTPAQARKIAAYYLENHSPENARKARERVVLARQQVRQFSESFPTTMVMEEMPNPRETCVLTRGAYDKRGEKVTPGVPACLPPLPSGAAANRLGFARWVADPANPLTARVAVNRIWQMYFGTGLVKTAEDFGSQGEWPTHPELLDWLATEFMRTGWNLKAMHRLIVTSATYKQASKTTPALLQADPGNRLLARGPRLRLPAETVRDQVLAASGLLVERIGGPSVKPYQPEGLWKELTDANYDQDHGDKLYRRSLYTFWKRTVPPPTMVAFDAPGREACSVREVRTNTPLQALTLMNEVTYVEAARVLAERLLTREADAEKRLVEAFRLITGRKPSAVELAVLWDSYKRTQAEYRKNPKAAAKLVSAGEFPRSRAVDVAELASLTVVAGLIMNLDETITKE